MDQRWHQRQQQIGDFVACVFEPEDCVEVRRLPSGRSTWHRAEDLSGLAESLAADNNSNGDPRGHQHIYVGANPRQAEGQRGDDAVALARCLFADVDNASVEDALARVAAVGLPLPTLTVHSGHGAHVYWRVDQPFTDLAQWRQVQKALIALLRSDPAIHNPERIMRLPGFANHKPPPATCSVHDADPSRVYCLADLLSLLIPGDAAASCRAEHAKPRRRAAASGLQRGSHLAAFIRRAEVDAVAQAPEGQRNQTLNTAAFKLGQLVAGGYMDRVDVEADLHAAAVAAGLGDAETRRTIASGIDAGMLEPRRLEEKKLGRGRSRSQPRPAKPPTGADDIGDTAGSADSNASTATVYPAPDDDHAHDHADDEGDSADADADADTDDADAGLVPLGTHDPDTGRLVLSPRRTLPTAEAFVEQFYTHPHGRTLHNYAGMLMSWRDNRYVEIEDVSVRHQLQPWLHRALRYVVSRRTGQPELVEFESNPTTVNAALETIRSYVYLPAATVSPSWLDTRVDRPDPREIVACRSSLLHLPTMQQQPPTPAFFAVNALDYDPDPAAKLPEAWLNFLGQLFGDDLQAWDLLQDWFGYCLTGDTSQHKMLLLVGPKRSGKGTIARVLTRLVGGGNVAGPTTSSLAGSFGLQPLVGKSLAIVSDARFHGENIQTVIERLLCISGEDMLTIDRKHTTSVTMKLPTRFVFLTNELPRLSDASGALAGRFMILRLTESFYGREDKTLTQRLLAELPGILNWAIEGWKRLRDRGHFVQPASVEDAVRDMEDLSSPVLAFVRDCCVLGPDQRAWVDELYQAWKAWCEREGRAMATTRQVFGRDLCAAVPGIATRVSTGNLRFYHGISVKGEPPC